MACLGGIDFRGKLIIILLGGEGGRGGGTGNAVSDRTFLYPPTYFIVILYLFMHIVLKLPKYLTEYQLTLKYLGWHLPTCPPDPRLLRP